jgi:AMP nucleosidase
MSLSDRDFSTVAGPRQAIDRLALLHERALTAQRTALERFLDGGPPPTAQERLAFRYAAIRVVYRPDGVPPVNRRAYAKFQRPGLYETTLTQPEDFRTYLMEQLTPLVEEYGATLAVGVGEQEIPYPYVFERGDELGRGAVTASELARFFPVPLLSAVGDEIADGLMHADARGTLPLALFDGARTDYSLRRLVHYTGTDWRDVQPWILLTNYHRYVDQFVRWGLEQVKTGGRFDRMVLPGGITIDAEKAASITDNVFGASTWANSQMPAYHLTTPDRQGITLVNIGVGPSNAKNITDHLAVLRPHCFLMVGHCGGLRQSQQIGDYVLAHAYLRQDRILDTLLPPDIPIPALAEVQIALQEAASLVTGERGDALKERLRTGTVVTNVDRNWELRFTQERHRINLSRAIAVDMESGTIAAQGYRLRVPYGTLLCVSDKPLHGEIKLPGAANAFYERAIGQHLAIGIKAVDLLRDQIGSLHSRKLRSFDETPFR